MNMSDVTINTHIPLFMKSKKVVDIYANKECTESYKIGHIIYNDSKESIDKYICDVVKLAVGEEKYNDTKIVTIDEIYIYEEHRDVNYGKTALLNLCDQFDADNTVIFASSYIRSEWYRAVPRDGEIAIIETLIPFMEKSAFRCVTTGMVAIDMYTQETNNKNRPFTDVLTRTCGDLFIFENNCGIDVADLLDKYRDKIKAKCED